MREGLCGNPGFRDLSEPSELKPYGGPACRPPPGVLPVLSRQYRDTHSQMPVSFLKGPATG